METDDSTQSIIRLISDRDYSDRWNKAISPGEDPQEITWLEKVSQSHQARIVDDFINLRDGGKELYTEISRYLKNANKTTYEDVEDAMGEVQVKVWQNRNYFDLSKKAKPWIYTIASNAFRDYQRRNKRHDQTVKLDQMNSYEEDGQNSYANLIEAPFEKTAEQNEEAEMVRMSIDLLPESSRQVVQLIYFQGLKYREVANILGIPLGTVKSRVHATIRNLKESELIQKLKEAA